jgi:ATP-binding cassette subfamily F protein 3
MLDEPTNHLDIKSCEALENALQGYGGTMFVISHDRYLINRLATRIVALSPDGMREFSGNYDDYLSAVKAEAETKAAVEAAAKKEVSENAASYQQQKENKAELRKLRAAFRRLEDDIERMETELAALEETLNDPKVASDYGAAMEITQQMDDLRVALEEHMEEWERLSEQIGL